MSVEQKIGPHIPTIQGEFIPGTKFELLGIHFGISNTVLTTWIFMILLFVIAFMFSISLKKKSSWFKSTGLIIVKGLYDFAGDFIGEKKFAKRVLFLVGGMFLFIFLSNIFSLFLDWILLFAGEKMNLHEYLRPINSDPNTTFALSLSIIAISHFVAVFKRGLPRYLKGYAFNFHGEGMFEKSVNVFVGWLHFIGEIVKALSLSLRLFGNIFAGVVLISMLAFLGGMINIAGLRIGEIFVLPFWFFELFVALVQAIVFFVLASIYFKQAIEEHH